jgi:hypothetical protein
MRGGRLAVALAALLAAPALASTYVVRGGDEAELLVPAGVRVEPYENNGYRLEIADATASIRVAADPLDSRQAFRVGQLPPSSAPAAQLARAVAADAATRFEAVSRILAWVVANVRYDLDRGAPQDAASVLSRRSAYCTGVARLSVALLDALAIPAREVAGYVVEDLPGGGRSGFHRWIEIFYDDRGWVFADPLASHHFVPASYLRLASSTIESEIPGPALLLSRREELREVDLRSQSPAARVRARANGAERYAAVVAVRTDARPPATAVLDGGGVQLRLDIVEGRAVFFGVLPATYSLRIWSEGRIATERRLEIERPEWTDLNIAIGEAPFDDRGGKR